MGSQLETSSLKLEIDATVHAPQFQSSVTANLNCDLCRSFVVTLEKYACRIIRSSMRRYTTYCTVQIVVSECSYTVVRFVIYAVHLY